jgi:hypothetical protein
MKFKLEPATDRVHKFVAIFDDTKRVPFGAYGMSDYTINKNRLRRDRYLLRHRTRENWNDPMTAGSLSKHILWGPSTNIDVNIREFKRKFNLE